MESCYAYDSTKLAQFPCRPGITLLLAAAPARAQSALDDILNAKVLKVAVQTDSAPYGFVGTDLEPQGLDIEMAELIGEKLGVKVELVPVTSANRIPYLQTQKANLVISTLGKNPEREKVIDFTSAYSPFFQAVYGPKNNSVKSSPIRLARPSASRAAQWKTRKLARSRHRAPISSVSRI